MMKKISSCALAAAVFLSPTILCSCFSDKNDPQAVEVKPDGENNNQSDICLTPQDPGEAEAALIPEMKAEPAPEAKPAPAPAPEAKPAKPVPAPETKPAPAPVPEKQPKITLPCQHTVCTGDNLWKIARQYYGVGSKWKLILDANKDRIKKAELLEPGMVLTIPADK